MNVVTSSSTSYENFGGLSIFHCGCVLLELVIRVFLGRLPNTVLVNIAAIAGRLHFCCCNRNWSAMMRGEKWHSSCSVP